MNGDGRVIAFRRSDGSDEVLVVASLNNRVFDEYVIQTDQSRLPDGEWRELFNGDAARYGGDGAGNFGADLPAGNGRPHSSQRVRHPTENLNPLSGRSKARKTAAMSWSCVT